MFSLFTTEETYLNNLKDFYLRVKDAVLALPDEDPRKIKFEDSLRNIDKLQKLRLLESINAPHAKERYLSEWKYHWEAFLLNFDTEMNNKNPKISFDQDEYKKLCKQFNSMYKPILKRTAGEFGKNNPEQRVVELANTMRLTIKSEAQEKAAPGNLQYGSVFFPTPAREETKSDVIRALIIQVEKQLKVIQEGMKQTSPSDKAFKSLATKQGALVMLYDFLQNLSQQKEIDWRAKKQEFADLRKNIDATFPIKKEMKDEIDLFKTVELKLDDLAIKISKSFR